MIAALVGHGPPAHRVWLPPLDAPPPLDEVLGVPASGRAGGSRRPCPAGAARPRRPGRPALPAAARPAGRSTSPDAAGHLAVVGGPAVGQVRRRCARRCSRSRSPTPRPSWACTCWTSAAAAWRRSPASRTSARSPAASSRTWCGGSSPSWPPRWPGGSGCSADAGVGSVEEFRARRAAGEFPDEPATDLLLVVDGYLVLRGEFDDLEARLLPLAAQGLSYGLHLAVSANRWSELRPALKDLLGSRLELRLGEPAESEVDRRRAAAVPARPGHGLAPDGAPMVLAAPWLRPVGRRAGGRHRRPRRGRRRGLARPRGRPGRAAAGAARHRRPAAAVGRASASRSASTRRAWPASRSTSPPTRTWCASPTPRAARPRCCGCWRAPSPARYPPDAGRGSWSSTTGGACSAPFPTRT